MAGVLDSDGSIWITRSTRKPHVYTLRLSVTNTASVLPEWFAETLGGNVLCEQPKHSAWRPAYRWHATGARAGEIAALLLPYLVVKRQQALIAIEFASTLTSGGVALPPAFRRVRERLYQQMLELNRRGTG